MVSFRAQPGGIQGCYLAVLGPVPFCSFLSVPPSGPSKEPPGYPRLCGAPRRGEGQSACPAAEATDVRTCFSPAPTTPHRAVWLSLPSASCAASLGAPTSGLALRVGSPSPAVGARPRAATTSRVTRARLLARVKPQVVRRARAQCRPPSVADPSESPAPLPGGRAASWRPSRRHSRIQTFRDEEDRPTGPCGSAGTVPAGRGRAGLEAREATFWHVPLVIV